MFSARLTAFVTTASVDTLCIGEPGQRLICSCENPAF